MKFLPKNTFVGKNSDGSEFRIQEWDYQTLLTFDIMQFLFMMVLAIFFGTILGPITVMLTILAFDGRLRVGHFIAIIASSIFLYDCYCGWIGTIILYLFLDESQMNYLVILNVTCIVIMMFLTLFGGILHKHISNKCGDGIHAKQTFILFVIGISLIGFIIGKNITNKNIGWLGKNTGVIENISKK